MPRIGSPRRGQIARLWPGIWREFRTPQRHSKLSSYGIACFMIVLCAFCISALFSGPTQVIAAPFQAAPTEIRATATLAVTVDPQTGAEKPEASETAALLSLPPFSPLSFAGTP